jgi:hypothetical protein
MHMHMQHAGQISIYMSLCVQCTMATRCRKLTMGLAWLAASQ